MSKASDWSDDDIDEPWTTLEALAKITHKFGSTTLMQQQPVGDEVPVSVDAAQKQLNKLTMAIDVHNSELKMLQDVMAILTRRSIDMSNRRRAEQELLLTAKDNLAKAKYAEAERSLADSLAPDLTNPKLQLLVKHLESWSNYSRMDSYQVEDVVFMLDRWLRTKDQQPSDTNLFIRGIINANDTGMGKTLETIAFLYVMRQVNPTARIIWFTKSPLVKETAPESTTKWNFDMVPVTGATTQDKLNLINVLMNMPFPPTIAINYEAVNQTSLMKALGDDWDFMVIDEVHKLRGGSNYTPTQMWTNTKAFKTRTNAFPIMLSGSIINNKSRELWAFLHIMDSERWPDVSEFEAMMRYTSSDSELMKVLAPSMFRRRKDEVDIAMPERLIRHHVVELTKGGQLATIYNQFATEMGAWLNNQDNESVRITFKAILDQLIRMRAVLIAPGTMTVNRKVVDNETLEVTTVQETLNTGTPEKLDYAAELINELLEEGQQVVVVSSGFKAPLNYLYKAIDPRFTAEKIYGEFASDGGDVSQRFRAGETQVILTNLQSGAEGFNWHQTDEWPGGAAHLIMIDDWYNPALVHQVWDRVWRRGSKNRVIIHMIQVDNSVDQFVEQIRLRKEELNSSITESSSLRASEWKDLLRKALGQ